MNFNFFLIALIFFLVPEAPEALLFDEFKGSISSQKRENSDNKWLEEEREIEDFSSEVENKIVESGNSSGDSYSVLAKEEKDFVDHNYYTYTSFIVKFLDVSSKHPKYIEYCSLKLHC
tara:strand:+ start:632 stop:985 length:354 start_codon:yes stop_codon:yes gene_type:complete